MIAARARLFNRLRKIGIVPRKIREDAFFATKKSPDRSRGDIRAQPSGMTISALNTLPSQYILSLPPYFSAISLMLFVPKP